MRRLWSPGARPEMPFIAPVPRPPAPQHSSAEDGGERLNSGLGKIDLPTAAKDGTGADPETAAKKVVEVDTELLLVAGWATFDDGPCARVEVWLGETALGRARVGVPRPDVATVIGDPWAEFSGFELTVATAPLLESSGGAAELRAVSTGPSGQTHELEPLPIVLSAPAPELEAAAPAAPTVTPAPLPEDRGLRTLVFTHQLTLGGAQLYLMDLLRSLRGLGAIEPVVVCAIDGPLRPELEALGIPVHLTELLPTGKHSSRAGRIEEFLAWCRPFGFDLVLINTATSVTVSGGEVAAQLGIPAVWTIHESFEPALLWADLSPEGRANAEATVSGAALAIFEATATQRIYEPLVDSSRCRTLPYGLDITPIDALRAGFDRGAARRQAGIPAEVELVVCVGTVEPRKGQVPLAEAFDLIAERHPHARLAFVGGREEDPNTVALEDCVAIATRGEQMEVIPITPDVASWYGMADLLVCSSDVESLPRTVLEAMAWETPVLATSVFGLPELLDDGETGWLCEPRDVGALADGLDRALSTPAAERARIAKGARELVARRHDLEDYGRQVGDLLRRAVEDRAAV